MASSSSSSSSSERRCKYDVFLNFRGEDTRKNFVGHLHKALEQRGLNTFIDSEDVGKGHDLSVLLEAISDSKLWIVVFSQDYASSTWCLKELVQTMKCNATQKQIVVPIFYQLDPSHVRKQEASFSQAFVKHESNGDLKEVQSWRSALTKAANFSGWDSRDYKDDAKLIDAIAVDVFNKLIPIRSSEVNEGLVGMDSHMNNMRRLLSLSGGKSDVVYVGIWGMGGIGKTTIARAVYKDIAHLFEHRCFLDNVRERLTEKDTVQTQEEFLSAILNSKVKSLDGGDMMMMKRLGDKKILVVLDDVNDSNQTDTLLGMNRSFGGGSKIIVTTRDEHVLQRNDFKIYNPKPLSDPDGLKLFSWYAFKTNKPSEEYDLLSRRALDYAQGLPLALRILGSHLHNRSVSVWEEELEKIKKISNPGIQRVLRTSYDGLDSSQKIIFLDIACFFKRLHRDYVTHVLASFVYPLSGLDVLLKKALVTVSKFGGLEMHDLLQEMGREIVEVESPKEPWKRQRHRLWSFEDVQDVLTQNKGMEVKGIIIELPNFGDINLNVEGFVNLRNLRLLRITYPQYLHQFYKRFEGEPWPEQLYHSSWECNCNFHLNGDLKFISHKLRVLAWHRCPLKSLPSNFDPQNLVDLDMRDSHIEQLWVGTKRIKELISINLSDCKYLKEIPLCTEATKLEKLILDGCISLLEVHPSISALEKLVFLSLRRCTKIKELPSSIERLRSLKSLSMTYCRSLVRLPDNICNLADLTYLYLEGCSKLHNLPENFGSLESLLELELYESGIEQLPVSILRLKLGRSIFNHCTKMDVPISSWRTSSIEGPYPAVVSISLSTGNLLELSDAIAHFSSLKILDLSKHNFRSLPATMNRLVFLERLKLTLCMRLKSIPELSSSISYINAHRCGALETVSTPKRPYDMGRYFKFTCCDQLVQNDLFRDIVETHFPPQGNYSRPFYICFPGREIPERFIHQCNGSSVTAQLPPNWVDNKFLGFAICAVTYSPIMDPSVQCFCTFKGNHYEYRFSFYLFRRQYEVGYFDGNHMFLGYVPWSEFGINGEEVNERCFTEAKFEIQLLHEITIYDPGFACIKRCGVQFFFANNEEVTHQDFGEPMVHSEPSGSDITSDISDEEQYLKLTELFGGANRNFREYDCEIEDNDSSGKRKILSRWTQQVRVTSGLMQGHLDDGFSWHHFDWYPPSLDVGTNVYYVCTPQNVRGCMSMKEVRYANEDRTILKITCRGRHTCTQASTISIGGRGDSRNSKGGGALRIHDQVVQSPTSLVANGGGGNVIRLADKAVDDNNVNILPDANSQDMEHFQNVNDMANNDMAVYGVPSEGTSDVVVKQLEEEDPLDYEEALDFNGLQRREREMMDSDDDQPNESNSISNNNP